MYKVSVYKYISDTNKMFKRNSFYYVREGKGDSSKKFLTTENPGEDLCITSGKMSLASDHYRNYLKENFEYVGDKMYKSFKHFRKNAPVKLNVVNGIVVIDDTKKEQVDWFNKFKS